MAGIASWSTSSSLSDGVSTTPLDEDDLFEVESELTPVSARWRRIGSALRLKANVLDRIEAANLGNPDKCLSQAIVEWLRLNYNVERFGRPSWKWLVEVVANPAGGNNTDLATRIASKYQDLPDPPQEVETQAHVYQLGSKEHQVFSAHMPWYHGNVSRNAAEQLLSDKPYESFLVRQSQTQPGGYTISLKHEGKVKHFLIDRSAGQYEVRGTSHPFPSLPSLVQHYSEHPLSVGGALLKTVCPKKPDTVAIPLEDSQSSLALSTLSVYETDMFPSTKKLKVKWRRVADMPVGMRQHHVVRIGNQIYCGGGYGTRTISTAQVVFQYDLGTKVWTEPFPSCPTIHFGLTHLEGRLVAVGGRLYDAPPSTYTNCVYILEGFERWRESLPMPTARGFPSVFTHKSHIISCGGITHWTAANDYTCTTAVEIFSHEVSQWFRAEPLPIDRQSMSNVTIKDTCYLIAGSTQVNGISYIDQSAVTASLSELISTALPADSPVPRSRTPPVWRYIHSCPHPISTAAEFEGNLVAIGGKSEGEFRRGLHMYTPSTDSWQELVGSDLPQGLCLAVAAQLATGEVMVVGGKENAEKKSVCKGVFIGTVC